MPTIQRIRLPFVTLLGCVLSGCAALAEDADLAAAELSAEEAAAAPLPGVDGEWTYTEIAGTQCRDGTPSGVATNLSHGSSHVLIYLEGGSWCTDELSCAVNSANARSWMPLLGWAVGQAGMFDRNDRKNPVRDWNFVYVPYCSGDLHSGANPRADVPGVGPQVFVGYLNMQKFLARIAPTFGDATHVLLTGGSAGGLGALRTSLLVQRAFPNVPVQVLSDAGPPVSKAVYAPCLQWRERAMFSLDRTIFAECGGACRDPDNGWLEFSLFVARTLRTRPSGLVVSIEDGGVRGFLGEGNDNCSDPALDRSIPAEQLRADLLRFRERLRSETNFFTFYPDTDLHTWLESVGLPGFGDLHSGRAGDVRLLDWFAQLTRGEQPGHAGP